MKIPRSVVILLLVLIFATIFNSFLHLRNPSYKYYRENFELLRKSFADYKVMVANEFLPSIHSIATNRMIEVNQILSNSNNNINNQKEQNKVKEINTKDFLHSEVNGRHYIQLFGRIYKEGDYVMGEPIIYFDDFICKTPNYHFLKDLTTEKEKKKTQESEKKEIKK